MVGGHYRFGVVPGVLALFEPELDKRDGIVNLAVEHLVIAW